MDTSRKLQATKVIDAPASAIFELLADPARHPDLDGSGTVRGVEGEALPMGGIGQSFTMNMHHPDLGDYRMNNTVTAFHPGSRIGWGPTLDSTGDAPAEYDDAEVGGHTFTYDLRETDGGTEVTETYEWMSVKDPAFLKLLPLVTQEQLERSLDRLAEAVSEKVR